MRFDIITIFPEVIEPYLNTSVLKRARERRLIEVRLWNLRDFAGDKRKTVDDAPYGGGAGMVLMADPVLRAVDKIRVKDKRAKTKIVVFSAKGKQFNQQMARGFAKKYKRLILVTGRYEGIDERVVKALAADEISIGPYVLTDGDIAAMAVLSTVGRLIPHVIKFESLKEESHWNLCFKNNEKADGGLEYPQYTRPKVFKFRGKKYRVPGVLLSGDHARIQEWRRKHQG